MTSEKLNLSKKEIKSIIEILKDIETILPISVYKCIANRLLKNQKNISNNKNIKNL